MSRGWIGVRASKLVKYVSKLVSFITVAYFVRMKVIEPVSCFQKVSKEILLRGIVEG